VPDDGRATNMSDHTPSESVTEQDIVTEGARLIGLATAAGLVMRALGGVAVHLTCPSAGQPPLARTYGDLDFAVLRREARGVREQLERSGYSPERHFNALHGDKRLLYVDTPRARKVDVFVGSFRMCHTLDLEDRLALAPQTLAPADLLLTKLQIVQFNAKDALDSLAILADHATANQASAGEAAEVIDVAYITALCAKDWGWYTTVMDNLARIEQTAVELTSVGAVSRARDRLVALREALEQAPKTFAWRARAAVGRRVQWYEEPEEIRQ
jgi:hypothetical protein